MTVQPLDLGWDSDDDRDDYPLMHPTACVVPLAGDDRPATHSLRNFAYSNKALDSKYVFAFGVCVYCVVLT